MNCQQNGNDAKRQVRFMIIRAHHLAGRLDAATGLAISDYTTGMVAEPDQVRIEELDGAMTVAAAITGDRETKALANELHCALGDLRESTGGRQRTSRPTSNREGPGTTKTCPKESPGRLIRGGSARKRGDRGSLPRAAVGLTHAAI